MNMITLRRQEFTARVPEILAMEAKPAVLPCRRLDDLFESLLHRVFREKL